MKVASEDACVDGEGDVGEVADVLALNIGNFDDVGGLTDLARLAAADEDELDFGFVEEVVETDEDGAWETTLTIPAASEPGDVFMIIAACFADEAGGHRRGGLPVPHLRAAGLHRDGSAGGAGGRAGPG